MAASCLDERGSAEEMLDAPAGGKGVSEMSAGSASVGTIRSKVDVESCCFFLWDSLNQKSALVAEY